MRSAFKMAFKNSVPRHKKYTSFTTDVIWVNTKVFSVTSKPTQRSSTRVSSLKDSSVLQIVAHFCVHPYNICGEASALLMTRSRVFKSHFKGYALFLLLCAFCLCSDFFFFSVFTTSSVLVIRRTSLL